MKKIFGVSVVLALLLMGMAGTALAQCGTGVMIKFDSEGFAYETNYTPATYNSAAGSVLSIVGQVSYFCSPMAALDPNDPTKEYTFYITGLVSMGTQVFGPFGGTTFYETDYNTAGASWEIHEGSPENAPTSTTPMPALPSVLIPSTFIDGPVVLSGILLPNGTNLGFHTSVSANGSNINGSFLSDYMAQGGTFFAAVGDGRAVFQGNWCVVPQPTGCVPATYSAHPNGKWDTPPTTATTKSTWGSIKQLYR